MDANQILRKTMNGVAEIKSSQLGLNPHLRLILIVVDGKTSVSGLHHSLSRMRSYRGFDELIISLQTLVDTGLLVDANKKPVLLGEEYGQDDWSEQYALQIKDQLIQLAQTTLAEHATKVVKKLQNSPNSKKGLVTAITDSEKVVRLFIDEQQASELARKSRALIIDAD